MEIKQKVEVEKVVDIQCDICGKSCTTVEVCGNIEFATLSAKWGYDTRKDLKEHECHMCEDCFDKIKDFIENQLKGKIREYECCWYNGERLDETTKE